MGATFLRINCLLLGLLLAGGCNRPPADRTRKNDITVAVAANAEPAISEISGWFTAETGIQVVLIKGSSGKLYAQILNGAPYDLFLSADTTYPRMLLQAGKASAVAPPYAAGQLAVWHGNKTPSTVPPDDRAWPRVLLESKGRIGIPNPQNAPFGRAAIQLLEQHGLLDSLAPRLVYGESVAQVALYIREGVVDMAITSYSTRSMLPDGLKGDWMVPDPSRANPRLPQGVALIRNERGRDELSRLFHDFLDSEKAKEILKRHGYLSREETQKEYDLIQTGAYDTIPATH